MRTLAQIANTYAGPFMAPTSGAFAETNPRYVMYCASFGIRHPRTMEAMDQWHYPGGLMTGFLIWIGQRWNEWHDDTGFPRQAPKADRDHGHFDRWLAARIARGDRFDQHPGGTR